MLEPCHRRALLIGVDEYKYFSKNTLQEAVRGDIFGAGNADGLKAVLESKLGSHKFDHVVDFVGSNTTEEIKSFILAEIKLLRKERHDSEANAPANLLHWARISG